MGSSSNQDKQAIQSRILSIGRGFAVVDPERRREIDFDYVRAARRDESPQLRARRAAPVAWLSALRDPADEGGSVRRSR
ncbi:hypothetical protein [Ramlibacter sp.]|jgi:hypothetical protein|uniref:hypothetical protein n=1 Tax=Ramlibacter sp. TaxID=1917967 RepID=UPI002FCB1EF6|nr:hypothetical protein [Ramlibacter sp.]MCE3272796.1 hypothetical protein [Ramlibacter sp.]